MDTYFVFLLKRNAQFLLSVITLLLCVFAIFESRAARMRAETPTIIAIDSNGTRVVARQNDPIFESEVINFSKMFLIQLYNFTPQTFMKSVGGASSYMSQELWKTKEEQLLRYSETVKTQESSLSGSIRKMSELVDGSYRAEMDIAETSRMKTTKRRIEVVFKLERVPRDERNQWGFEVTKYDEKALY